MVRLFAARHAKVPAAAGLCSGRLDWRAELPPEKAWQELWSAEPGLGLGVVAAVWSSRLSRCAELADSAAQALGVPSRRDDRLLELSYGVWEGRAWADIEREDPERFRAWMANWESEPCPGGESARDVEARVRAWWSELSNATHVLIGHAGVLRALQVIVDGRLWPDAMSSGMGHLEWRCFTGDRPGRTGP